MRISMVSEFMSGIDDLFQQVGGGIPIHAERCFGAVNIKNSQYLRKVRIGMAIIESQCDHIVVRVHITDVLGRSSRERFSLTIAIMAAAASSTASSCGSVSVIGLWLLSEVLQEFPCQFQQ